LSPAAVGSIVAAAASPTTAAATTRIRLPDKLLEYLDKQVAAHVLWWQVDGDCFALDSTAIQTEFLDKHLEGIKLKSFIRSLNRWYVFILRLFEVVVEG